MTMAAIVSVSLILAVALRSRATLENAYKQGERDALKQAAAWAKERGDVAAYMSPGSDLRLGSIRAQVAYSIELELRQMRGRVR
jgi:hypothetical protein